MSASSTAPFLVKLTRNRLLGQVIAANRLVADSFAEGIVAESLVH